MDKIDIEEEVLDNENEIEINGQSEEQIYPMDSIKVEKGFYTIFELKRRYDAAEKRIILDSDFQRDTVWNRDRKAELVESVLMGLPLPIFYFNQDKYGRLIVVDGRQRLTALFEFMDDKYALKNLKVIPELNGLKFSKLSPILMSRLEDYQLQAHVIIPPTPDRIKFDIFDRVNRGGVQLNKQEIRNALYQGKATKMLSDIVKTDIFANATGNAFKNERRMKDKYLITRLVTLMLYREDRILDDDGRLYEYKGDIDDFLGRGMDAINNLSDKEVKNLKEKVKCLLGMSFAYLGGDAFRIRRNGKKSPINMNVFETIMLIFLSIQGELLDMETVDREISIFIQSDEFLDSIGNHRDSAVKLNWRIKYSGIIGRKISRI